VWRSALTVGGHLTAGVRYTSLPTGIACFEFAYGNNGFTSGKLRRVPSDSAPRRENQPFRECALADLNGNKRAVTNSTFFRES
jgi:hypothetical protein